MYMISASDDDVKRTRSASDLILPTPQPKHPYLSGNFAPIHQTLPLTPCQYTGSIPEELADGEYVRNGSNPVSNDDLGRDAHWFDGDGMLSGVSFRKNPDTGHIEPDFVNQFVLTDLYLSAISSPKLRVPILPSIATLVNPLATFIYVTLRILRAIFLVILSHLPGSKQAIKKISVANTNVVYHDGRALATCESGPPIRIQLPGLETVGWFDGVKAEGEPETDITGEETRQTLGHEGGLIQFMREWTTAHPKVDPETKEMLMFHSSFAPPYVQYSVIPQRGGASLQQSRKKLVNAAVSGVHSAKMMHDFGVSRRHTVIMDLPLSLDPVNQLTGKPTVAYDSSKPSRFGIFPRHDPRAVRWFETDGACIFHTANTWDTVDAVGRAETVNMLACRLTSATLVFAAGNMAPPVERRRPSVPAKRKRMPFFSRYDEAVDQSYIPEHTASDADLDEKMPLLVVKNNDEEAVMDEVEDPFSEEQCRLYYYEFALDSGEISQQWALSHIPFEFPSVRPNVEMREARYIYGCSTTSTSFGAALGKATKIDCLVKMDASTLIARGKRHPPKSVTGSVDTRTMAQVLNNQDDTNEPIKVFRMPEGWFAQEPRFVPASSNDGEDDGYLLFYAFDESQLSPEGDAPPDTDAAQRAVSEMWVVKAKDMRTVLACIKLPQRVPYGLHGAWFSADDIAKQRPVDSLRTTAKALEAKETGVWMTVRDWIEKQLA